MKIKVPCSHLRYDRHRLWWNQPPLDREYCPGGDMVDVLAFADIDTMVVTMRDLKGIDASDESVARAVLDAAFRHAGNAIRINMIDPARASSPRCVCCRQSLGPHSAIEYCDPCNHDLCLTDDGESTTHG